MLHDLDAYFAALTAYRGGDIEPIVTVFVDAVGEAVRNGNLLFNDIRTIREEYDAALVGLRSDAAARRVVDVMFEHPVVNVALLQQHLGIADQTAHRAIDTLVDRGILTPQDRADATATGWHPSSRMPSTASPHAPVVGRGCVRGGDGEVTGRVAPRSGAYRGPTRLVDSDRSVSLCDLRPQRWGRQHAP